MIRKIGTYLSAVPRVLGLGEPCLLFLSLLAIHIRPKLNAAIVSVPTECVPMSIIGYIFASFALASMIAPSSSTAIQTSKISTDCNLQNLESAGGDH